MRMTAVALALLALTACKPSDFYAPEQKDDELLGAPDVKTAAGFPAGCWEDGLGNAWNVSVTGNSVSASSAAGNQIALTLTGAIKKDELDYSIGLANATPLATGSARLIDSRHAWFKTSDPAGQLDAHGLLHFNHPAQLTAGQPAELQPVADCANPTP
jgi:hypothetical protein